MKKVWKYFILVALLGALMCTAAFAVDEPTFTDKATGATFTMDASGEKFEVSYTGATSGQYLILMVAEGDGDYTITDESIMYVNQDAASADGVAFTVYPTKMVNAKIMLGGGTGSPVTLGYLEMPVPDVTVNVVGSSNAAETTISADGTTLTVENDQACVVVYTIDDGATYEVLKATKNDDGSYDYDLTQLPAGAEVSVAVKGDENMDGKVDFSDLQRLYQHLSTSNKLTGAGLILADVNENGGIDFSDLQRLYQHLSTNNKLDF